MPIHNLRSNRKATYSDTTGMHHEEEEDMNFHHVMEGTSRGPPPQQLTGDIASRVPPPDPRTTEVVPPTIPPASTQTPPGMLSEVMMATLQSIQQTQQMILEALLASRPQPQRETRPPPRNIRVSEVISPDIPPLTHVDDEVHRGGQQNNRDIPIHEGESHDEKREEEPRINAEGSHQGVLPNSHSVPPVRMPPPQAQVVKDLTINDVKKEIHEFLKRERSKTNFLSSSSLDYKPPYPEEIASMPYPEGYVSPKFRLYDGRRGNVHEHIARFVEALANFSGDENLRLREFSKSLTDKAYTWYANLKPGTISSWEELAFQFHSKFFHVDERMTRLSLAKVTQRPNEDLVAYVKRFREASVDCSDPLSEVELIRMCIDGMHKEYKLNLLNVEVYSFTSFLEKVGRLNEVIKSPSLHLVTAPRQFHRRPTAAAADYKRRLVFPSEAQSGATVGRGTKRKLPSPSTKQKEES